MLDPSVLSNVSFFESQGAAEFFVCCNSDFFFFLAAFSCSVMNLV